MRSERLRRRPAVERLQHRRLHLEVSEVVHRAADRRRHLGARGEVPAHVRVHREIGVALPGPLFTVGETRVTHGLPVHDLLFAERQRTQRLRQHRHRVHAHRHLTRPRAKERAVHADHIAQIEVGEPSEDLLSQLVLAEVDLDPPRVITQVREDRLAVPAPGHDASRHLHHGSRLGAFGQERRDGTAAVRPVEPVGERFDTRGHQGLEILTPRLHHEVEFVAHRARPVVTSLVIMLAPAVRPTA